MLSIPGAEVRGETAAEKRQNGTLPDTKQTTPGLLNQRANSVFLSGVLEATRVCQ